MIVLGLDLETTGLDKVKDRPIEVGLTLWTTNFNRSLESRNFLIQSEGVSVKPEITEITGINQKMVDNFGLQPDEAYEEVEYMVNRAQALVAFNGGRLDIPMMQQWAKRLGKTFPDKLLIDPFSDLPKTSESVTPGMRGQEQITMCAKEKIYYDPHEAGADVGAMLRLMATRPFELVMQRAQSPTVVIQSHQARHQNEAVKKHKFRWNPDEKIWWKKVKQVDLDTLVREVNNEFGLSEIDIPLERLESND